jgi:hypothetical protein
VYVASGASSTIIPGLGGGAGGSVELGSFSRSYYSNGTQFLGTTSQNYTQGASNSVVAMGSTTIVDSSAYPYSSGINKPNQSAQCLHGYGAGGGNTNVSGKNGSGGLSTLPAVANSGGGAGSSYITSTGPYGVAGASGGSGYALITWWE